MGDINFVAIPPDRRPAAAARQAVAEGVSFHLPHHMTLDAQPSPVPPMDHQQHRLLTLAESLVQQPAQRMQHQQQQQLPERPLWQNPMERGTAAIMQGLVDSHGLANAFRQQHPHRRGYTFYAPTGAASRLDRAYVANHLIPHMEACNTAGNTAPDHRPLLLHLRPALPAQGTWGRGLPCLSLASFATQEVRVAMIAIFRECSTDAPLDQREALMAWWPGFKHRLLESLQRLSHRLRQAAHTPRRPQRQQVLLMRDRIREAQAALAHGGQGSNTNAARAANAALPSSTR